MKVVFENATLADSINKAARVAPTRGTAFDKANGIVMKVSEDDDLVMIRATNLDIFYLERVEAVSIEGEGEWRFPSAILDGILSKLPISSGSQVTLEDKQGTVSLKSGRTSAKIRTSDSSYFPTWNSFDADQLDLVPDLGSRIQQVEWAANKAGDPPLSGIHLDGEKIIATDRYRIASVPCEAEPIYKPITVPAGIFAPIIKNMRDVAVGIEAGQFLLMPDTATQIRAVIYADPYPNIERGTSRAQDNSVKFKKSDLLEIIDRAMVFGGRDRVPTLTMFVGSGEIAVMMSDAEQGLLGDVIDVPGYCDHPRLKILFTPRNLTEAVGASPSETVEMFYFSEPGKPVRLDGGSGYEAWVMPRRDGPSS